MDLYVEQLSSYSSRTVILDLGCGDAALARALTTIENKTLNVISYDLVGDGEFVVEFDMCGALPLPGSERTISGSAGIVDVVVCALSLMGTNWPNVIRESWRVLRAGYNLYRYPIFSCR